MFTGLIEEQGRIKSLSRHGMYMRIAVSCGKIAEDLKIGDSVAVNGICLTATTVSKGGLSDAVGAGAANNGKMANGGSPNESNGATFTADVMPETFRRTAFRFLRVGSKVNLERAMKADGRFGGHIVTGHIDGTGTVHSVSDEGNAVLYYIRAEDAITDGIVEKGSVAIDGISLTVVNVGKMQAYGQKCFCVSVIPHTRAVTTLSERKKGSTVNIECDILGKYAAKYAMRGATVK